MTKITNEVIEKINKINLVHYLERTEGYTFIENGCYWKCKQHDSLVVQCKNGHWHFEWNSQNQFGDIIDYVKLYQSNNNFQDAVKYILNHSAISNINSCITKEQDTIIKENNANIQINYNESTKRAYAYLIKSRGLDAGIVKQICKDGLLREDTRNNVVLHWVYNHKIMGAERKGTNTSNEYKNIANNSNENYGFSIPIGNVYSINKIIVFEASIDLLSYYSLYKEKLKNSLLLSLVGVSKIKKIGTYLKLYVKVGTIICCTDNDVAGNTGLKNIKITYSGYNVIDGRNELFKNAVKDFNDLLKKYKTLN